jgi:hypothetical protein
MVMAEPLFTVESAFKIPGRGTVLVGITLDQYGSVKLGDIVVVERPDGSTRHMPVRGIEYPPSIIWSGERPANPRYGVLVESAEDVPVGSVVMRVSNSATPTTDDASAIT